MAVEKWKRVSRKKILDHPRLELVEDTVLLPNGHKTTYLMAPAATHSVTVLAFNDAGDLLVQQEYSYPPDTIMWQLPGGKIDPGEDSIEAAKRELSEESGYTAQSTKVLGFYYTANRLSDAKQYVMLCTDLTPEKRNGDPEEFIDSEWVSVSKVNDLIAEGNVQNINLLAALKVWESYQHAGRQDNLG